MHRVVPCLPLAPVSRLLFGDTWPICLPLNDLPQLLEMNDIVDDIGSFDPHGELRYGGYS